MKDFAQAFQKKQIIISDALQRDRSLIAEQSSLVSQVPIPSCKVTFILYTHCGIYSLNVSIVALYALFCKKVKKFFQLNCTHMFLMCIFRIYANLGISIQHFLMRYSKMGLKIGGWKHSFVDWSNGWWKFGLSHHRNNYILKNNTNRKQLL